MVQGMSKFVTFYLSSTKLWPTALAFLAMWPIIQTVCFSRDKLVAVYVEWLLESEKQSEVLPHPKALHL